MCLQDLQIARKKYVKFNVGTAPATALTVAADPRRVGIVWGANAASAGGFASLNSGPSAAAGVRLGYVAGFTMNQVLTIEQVGQMITGQLTVDNVAAGTTAFLHEIFINESDQQLAGKG